MDSFKQHIDEASALKFYNLLPKKVRHAINRFAHQDKYKAALQMYRELKKNKDIKQRNLPDNQIKGIAADFFKLNRREFEKILNRKTRYEAVEDWEINEANLKIGDLKKDLWRWQAFVKKIKTGDPFITTDGKKIVLDKSILKGVKSK